MPARIVLRSIGALVRVAALSRMAGVVGFVARPLGRRRADAVLVVPPAIAGSRGDEALVEVVARGLSEHTTSRVRVSEWSPLRRDPLIEAINGVPPRGWWALARDRPERLVMIGADVFDGHYDDRHSARRWDLARFAARLGVRVDVVSLSWSGAGTDRPRTARAARRLPSNVHLHPRDPHSAARLAADGIGALAPTADLAFLLRPDPRPDEVGRIREWVAEQHRQGRRCVGIGPGAHLLGPVDGHPRRLAELASSLAELDSRGVSCVLIPHDVRAGADDAQWCAAIAARCRAFAHPPLVASPSSAGAAKAIVGLLDALVSQRMHLTIAALSQAIPAVTFDYQGKISGLGELLGEGVGVFRGTVDEWCARLADLVAEAETTAAQRSAALRAALPVVIELAGRTLSEITGSEHPRRRARSEGSGPAV